MYERGKDPAKNLKLRKKTKKTFNKQADKEQQHWPDGFIVDLQDTDSDGEVPVLTPVSRLGQFQQGALIDSWITVGAMDSEGTIIILYLLKPYSSVNRTRSHQGFSLNQILQKLNTMQNMNHFTNVKHLNITES